jgi:hypothetical protein
MVGAVEDLPAGHSWHLVTHAVRAGTGAAAAVEAAGRPMIFVSQIGLEA